MSDDDPGGARSDDRASSVGSPHWPRTLRCLPLYYINRDGEVENFDPEKAMGSWVVPDIGEVVWKIAPGRYVKFCPEYSEPEDAGEIVEPLLGRELTPSQKTWFADHGIDHTPDESIEAIAPKFRPEPKPQTDGGHEHVKSGVDQPPPPPRPIDYKAWGVALRKAGKRNPAALVEFMADKEEATAREIGEHVHGDKDASDDAIRMNVNRTNDALVELDSPLSFRFVSGYVYREISPK
jgi:hypothetical protein